MQNENVRRNYFPGIFIIIILTEKKIRNIIVRMLTIKGDVMMTFHYLLMANQAIYQRRLMEILKNTDLTPGQPKVLDYLKDHDGETQKEIAAACYIEAATITSVLNGMEAKGLIERKRLNGNRRSFHVFMTEKGRKMQKKVEEIFLKMEEETFEGISEEKRNEFMNKFSQIHKNITKPS